ncbi:MAG: hypothetical protein WBM29_02735 [Candidatus Deferrimicrobium sp.]
MLPSAPHNVVGHHHFVLSGLHHTAYMLAVYASQPRFLSALRPRHPAPRKTRFRLAATLAGQV